MYPGPRVRAGRGAGRAGHVPVPLPVRHARRGRRPAHRARARAQGRLPRRDAAREPEGPHHTVQGTFKLRLLNEALHEKSVVTPSGGFKMSMKKCND